MNQLITSAKNKQASTLILVVMTLALMISVAVTFMNIVGRQQGNAVGIAMQTHAEVAIEQAQAHAIRSFVESASEVRNKAGNIIDYTTSGNAPWRRHFNPVIDVDGDFWTEDDRTSTNISDINSGTWEPSTTNVSKHPLINTGQNLFHMMDHFNPWGGESSLGGHNQPSSRWHNHAWLTTDLKPILIDDSLSETEKVALRESARYVVRYTVQVYDLHGALSVNHNYPDILADGTNVATDALHYIRQQNYLRTFGRSIKSMGACYYMFDNGNGSKQNRTWNYTDTDPFDWESVGFYEDGRSFSRSSHRSLTGDSRISLERAFRGGDPKYTGDYNTTKLITAHQGRMYTWNHRSFAGTGRKWFVPYADNMRDADLADPGASVPVSEVSTPWRVNLLSAPIYGLRGMISGLSSEIRLTRVMSNADLFGKGYPEAFPLEFDDGKENPWVSQGKNQSGYFSIYQAGNGTHRDTNLDVYTNSYPVDVASALCTAIHAARRAWDSELEASRHRYNDDASTLIHPGQLTNANGEMIKLIMHETYRILGEHKVYGGATSYLSGDKTIVGIGHHSRARAYRYPRIDLDPDTGPHADALDVQIHDGANSRAMEYFLNDFMISLFGKANPDATFALNSNLALDFNGDGKAESTVTGWWDYSASSAGVHTFSWWWDGLGPFVEIDPENDFMKRPGWYRFVGGNVLRKIGDEWMPLTAPQLTAFYDYNDLWLTPQGSSFPIKAFSKTGRLFIGKSKIFAAFMRSEVFDLTEKRIRAASNRHFTYRLDPNNDGDMSDNAMMFLGEMKLINPDIKY